LGRRGIPESFLGENPKKKSLPKKRERRSAEKKKNSQQNQEIGKPAAKQEKMDC